MIIAFDCDGTLEDGIPSGNVKARDIELLAINGYRVFIISDSPNCRISKIPLVEYLPTPVLFRWKVLAMLRKQYNEPCIYVSDNPGDNIQARAGGCDYMHPSHWDVKKLLQAVLK